MDDRKVVRWKRFVRINNQNSPNDFKRKPKLSKSKGEGKGSIGDFFFSRDEINMGERLDSCKKHEIASKLSGLLLGGS